MSRSLVPVVTLLVLATAWTPFALAQDEVVDRTELLEGDASNVTGAVRIARFIQATDAQVVDDDFPYRPTMLDAAGPPFDAAARPQDEWTDEALNSIIAAFNAEHAKAQVDFVINTGDAVDNALENEWQRFIDNMDGTYTTQGPVTGREWTPDGDEGAPVTDAATSLPAAFLEPGYNVALNPTIPWYVALGNHDTLVNGNMPIQPGMNEVAAESGRHFLKEHELVRMLFGGSDPCVDGVNETVIDAGHGFAFQLDRLCDADRTNDGYYSFDHGLVHYVVLDTVNDEWVRQNEHLGPAGGVLGQLPSDAPTPTVGGYADGGLDAAQYAWLLADLDAHAAKPTLLFAHHTPKTIFVPDGASGAGFVDGARLADVLAERGNVLAFVGAHSHKHRIDPMGYWNVETASLMDAPHENRVIEVWVAPDGTGWIDTYPVAQSFQKFADAAATDDQAEPDAAGRPEDRAARLWFTVPDDVLAFVGGTLDRVVDVDLDRPTGNLLVDVPAAFTVTARGGFTGALPAGTSVTWTVTGDDVSESGPVTMDDAGVGTFAFTFTTPGLYNVTAAVAGDAVDDAWTRSWVRVKDPVADATDRAGEDLDAASQGNGIPAPAPLAILVALGAAGVVARRRR